MYLNDSTTLFCSSLERAKDSNMLIESTLYKTILTESKRFSRLLPLLLSVSNHEGIRIHAGNTYVDSAGCISVGDLVSNGVIEHSRVTERKIVELMKNTNKCTIDILF
ncbi:hypothetical protein AGMMS50233_06920 [Endomicrobiia bacterium]|nr:hypothetical protein AGMMS50233_06920 [Endomicrobiia bacterium]